MRRPVRGEVHVHHHQLCVTSGPEGCGPGLAEAFAGQEAGSCGAAVPGALRLSTGLHPGGVGFTAEVHDQAPPLETVWEDVVEVSFRPAAASTVLMQWAGEDWWDLLWSRPTTGCATAPAAWTRRAARTPAPATSRTWTEDYAVLLREVRAACRTGTMSRSRRSGG